MNDKDENNGNTNRNGNSDNSVNEETPLIYKAQQQHQGQDQQRGIPSEAIFKINDDDVSLDTLADSIRFIIKRDSEMSLHLKNKAPASPWHLDSVVRSPMLSHSFVQNIPDMQKRREDQLERYRLHKKQRKARGKGSTETGDDWEEQRRKMRRERLSVGTHDDNIIEEEGGGLEEEHKVVIHDEDEQWERKRIAKLQKVLANSSSNNSFASSTGFTNYSPTEDILKELKIEFSKNQNPPSVSIMYGIINTVIVLPVLMSFGSIIYHDEFFRPYLPVLIKLTVVSGVVHQLSFSTFSTLPFAVGQVQDAGLIFLSAIASSIVKYCKNDERDDEEILATTLVGLSIFTALLGVALVIIGRLKLANYVKMLPTAVVGGYLAFIGFFCGQGGLSLMSNVQVSGIFQWYKLAKKREILLSLPGLLGGFGIYFSMRTIKHMAVLPLSVALVIISFYFTLEITGMSLDDAKAFGWVNQADAPPVWYHTWDYIKFDKVVWSALPGQALTVISMIFVVALSSSLDIAAIDLEISKPLEYNYELRMIGLSNILSGCSGGYTGSYIFSQSIFSLRAGIRSRLMGYVIAICEAITVVIPISILNYVPNFVFGSLLLMICVDLMVEWLWDVRKKLSQAEYSVTLLTFFFIQLTSVEYGIICGIILHLVLLKFGFNVNSQEKDRSENSINEHITISEMVPTPDVNLPKETNIFSNDNGKNSGPIMV